MSRIPFPILNFLDSDVYAVMNPIFLKNLKKCASFSKNVAILLLSFKQPITAQSALQTSQKEKNDRIPFTLTFHPRNNPVKAVILNNFKILQNDPETGAIFSQPPLISFKRDKNVGNFLVRSASRYLVPTNSVAPSSVYKAYTTHNSSICSDEGLTLETSAFQSLYGGQFTLSAIEIV